MTAHFPKETHDLILSALDAAINIADLGIETNADLFLNCSHTLSWARDIRDKANIPHAIDTAVEFPAHLHLAVDALRKAQASQSIPSGFYDILTDMVSQLRAVLDDVFPSFSG